MHLVLQCYLIIAVNNYVGFKLLLSLNTPVYFSVPKSHMLVSVLVNFHSLLIIVFPFFRFFFHLPLLITPDPAHFKKKKLCFCICT